MKIILVIIYLKIIWVLIFPGYNFYIIIKYIVFKYIPRFHCLNPRFKKKKNLEVPWNHHWITIESHVNPSKPKGNPKKIPRTIPLSGWSSWFLNPRFTMVIPSVGVNNTTFHQMGIRKSIHGLFQYPIGSMVVY